jgi:hypothetical protein
MEDVATSAHAAMVARDWDALCSLLHPYLHWSDDSGQVLRGRAKVLTMLEQSAPPAPPTRVELRNGQIYRWWA